MFTVKHVGSDRVETLYEVTDVEFLPPNVEYAAFTQMHVSLQFPDCKTLTLFDGQVYVMNSFGNTVSKYYLNDPDDPAVVAVTI